MRKRGKKRQWTPKGCLLGLAGIMLMLMGLEALVLRDIIRAANRYDEEYALAEKEGALIWPETLRRLYGHPEAGAEAARRIHALPQTSTALSFAFAKDYDPSAPLSPTAAPGLLRHVIPLGDLNEFLRLEHCDFGYKWEQGSNISFPELTACRTSARALVLLADHDVDNKAYAAADQKIAAAFRLAEFVGESPTLIHMFVQTKIIEWTCFGVVRTAARHRHDPRVIRMLRQALDRAFTIDYVRAFQAELMWSLHNSQNIRRIMEEERDRAAKAAEECERTGGCIDEGFDSLADVRRWSRVPGVVSAWQTHELEWLRATYAALKQYPTDWRGMTTAAEAIGTKLDTDMQGGKVKELEYMLASILQPQFSRVFEGVPKPECHRQMALAWLDVLERFNGTWPATLPVERRDPYTGAPLRIEMLAGGPVIWSPGPNGKAEYASGRTAHTGDDVVLALPQAIASRLK